MEFIS